MLFDKLRGSDGDPTAIRRRSDGDPSVDRTQADD
jgi:hypothetical protein